MRGRGAKVFPLCPILFFLVTNKRCIDLIGQRSYSYTYSKCVIYTVEISECG